MISSCARCYRVGLWNMLFGLVFPEILYRSLCNSLRDESASPLSFVLRLVIEFATGIISWWDGCETTSFKSTIFLGELISKSCVDDILTILELFRLETGYWFLVSIFYLDIVSLSLIWGKEITLSKPWSCISLIFIWEPIAFFFSKLCDI